MNLSINAPVPTDDELIARCLALGDCAARLGEVPVGALVVCDGVIVGEGYNKREIDEDPLAHAELMALRAAARRLGRWRLSGCTLVVSLEPCFMCAGAIVNARVDRLVYGAADPKAGAVESLARVCTDPRLNHRVAITGGVQAEACSGALRAFFADLRRRNAAC
jgi:tRNA(adenine34) deaminase